MPRISAYRLQHVARVYAAEPAATVPFAELLEMAGAPADTLEGQDATVELLHEAGVVEAACRALDDKTFAARVGLAARGPGSLVAYLVRASDTLEDALALSQRFYAMHDSDIRLEMAGSQEAPMITLTSRVIPTHQYPRHRELLLLGLHKRVQQITSGTLEGVSVELETDDAEHCQRLSVLAECPVEGGHANYALRLPSNGMQFPIPTADPLLLSHLRKHGEDQLRNRPATTKNLSERIVDLLEDQLPGRVPNGDAVAAEFGMTRRTMTRRLASEGTSFKLLLDGVLCDLSKRLLRSGENVAQVAFMLDFSDQAAFSVAFKRWTGETPARFRRASR